MARFQATFSFVCEDIHTQEEALVYATEIASDQMLTTGEEVTVVEVEIVD